MQEFEPMRKEATISSENQNKTTLVIQDIPSEIAYRTIMSAITRGNFSMDETKNDVNERLGYRSSKENQESEIYYHTPKQNIDLNEDLGGKSRPLHSVTEKRDHNPVWQKVESPNFAILEECRCCDCGRVFAHRIKDGEKNQIFTDFSTVEEIFANDLANETKDSMSFDGETYDEMSSHGCINTPEESIPSEDTHRTR